jgi:hypothetical protein
MPTFYGAAWTAAPGDLLPPGRFRVEVGDPEPDGYEWEVYQ